MSNTRKWSGRIIFILIVLFMAFDGIVHVINPSFVVAAFAQDGFPDSLAVVIGVVELVCLLLYVIPRTSVLGAILLTGYLGGAVSINARAGMPLFSAILFPVYIGILVWLALYLRDPRLQDHLPIKKA